MTKRQITLSERAQTLDTLKNFLKDLDETERHVAGKDMFYRVRVDSIGLCIQGVVRDGRAQVQKTKYVHWGTLELSNVPAELLATTTEEIKKEIEIALAPTENHTGPYASCGGAVPVYRRGHGNES